MNKQKLAIIGSGRMAWLIGKNAHDMNIETHCFSNVEPDYIHETMMSSIIYQSLKKIPLSQSVKKKVSMVLSQQLS